MHGNAGSEMGQSGTCPNIQLSESDWEKCLTFETYATESDRNQLRSEIDIFAAYYTCAEQVNAEN